VKTQKLQVTCKFVIIGVYYQPIGLGFKLSLKQKLTSGSKFTVLSEEVLLFNKFFSDCRYVLWLKRYRPTKLYNGAQMAHFCRFFGSCISSEPRAALQTCIL